MDFLTDDTSTYRDLGAIFKTQYSPFNDVSDNQFTCTLSLTSIEKEAKICWGRVSRSCQVPHDRAQKAFKLTVLCVLMFLSPQANSRKAQDLKTSWLTKNIK